MSEFERFFMVVGLVVCCFGFVAVVGLGAFMLPTPKYPTLRRR